MIILLFLAVAVDVDVQAGFISLEFSDMNRARIETKQPQQQVIPLFII